MSPYSLLCNHQLCFQGSSILGMGFFITPSEASELLKSQYNMLDVVKPVMGGKELNDSADFTAPRWIIDMFERDELEAMSYKEAFYHLEKHVKPDRMGKDPIKYPRLVETWWKFWHTRGELYNGIKRLKLEKVLARARVSDHNMIAFLPNNIVYTEQLAIFLFDRWSDFAVLQSSIHECWARRYASTMKTDIRYIPTDCFGTFPLPVKVLNLNSCGQKYYEHRSNIMKYRNQGMTKIYNLFNNKSDISQDINTLRELQIEMDHEVALCYGWCDLILDHGFHETKQGLRYDISHQNKIEIIKRLINFNHILYQEQNVSDPISCKATLNLNKNTDKNQQLLYLD